MFSLIIAIGLLRNPESLLDKKDFMFFIVSNSWGLKQFPKG